MDENKRLHIIVLSVAFASFLARLNLYTISISLPTISNVFDIGTSETSRIVTVYLLVITSSLMLFGKLSDMIGQKNMFVAGYGVFILGSILCGTSTGINMLITSRAIHGLGSSMLMAASFAIIAKAIPTHKLGWAFGINATATAIGVAAGAPLGGIIAEYLSWRGVFLVNVPFGAAAVFCACRFIPLSIQSGNKVTVHSLRGFDFIGAVLSFFALSVLFYSTSMIGKQGWISLSAVSLSGLFLLSFFFFILYEKRHEDPLLDLNLLKNSKFTYALSATTMAYLLIAGNIFLLPFYLELVKGLGPSKTGMILLVYSLIYVFVSPYAGKLSDRKNPAVLCVASMAAAALNTFVFSYSIRIDSLFPVCIFLTLLGFSYVFFLSPINNLAMSCASKGKEGASSGMLNTAINLSMVFGVAIFELIFTGSLGDYIRHDVSLRQLNIPASILLNGFGNAYVAGGITCLLAMLFSFLARKQ